MDPATLQRLDEALLRCGARASGLRHPNREHPPTPEERQASIRAFRGDLAALARMILEETGPVG